MWLATLADTHLGEDEMREVIEYLETKEIEACGTPAYKDPAARALKAGVLIVWDPDHLQAKRDGKGGRGQGSLGQRGISQGGMYSLAWLIWPRHWSS